MLSKFRKKLKLKSNYPSCKISPDFLFAGKLENLSLGKNVEIQHDVFFHLGGYEWCDFIGKIEIGDNSIISPQVIIYGAGQGGVKIGNNFDCGPGVVITSSKTSINNIKNHDFGKVTIGDNVTLYANVVVSPGAIIEDNCVIGANSVVTSRITRNSLAIGNPAKVVKSNIRTS